MSRVLAVVLLTIAAPAFGAAPSASTPAVSPKSAPAAAPAAPAAASRAQAPMADYVLQPFDVIRVEVFKEPNLLRDVRIDQDSSITLPLILRVKVGGKTVRETQEMIRVLYDKDYLVNPQINVSVIEFSKRTVNVIGSVASPGSISIPPERPLNLIDAIAQAGGFTRVAEKRKVRVTRTYDDGRTQGFELNTEDIERSSASEVWLLKPGDVINVPERPF